MPGVNLNPNDIITKISSDTKRKSAIDEAGRKALGGDKAAIQYLTNLTTGAATNDAKNYAMYELDQALGDKYTPEYVKPHGRGTDIGDIAGRALKVAAPVAASFIPGVGPLAAAAIGGLGAGAGEALSGNGFKPGEIVKGAAMSGLGKFASGKLGGAKNLLGGGAATDPTSIGYDPAATGGGGLLGGVKDLFSNPATGNIDLRKVLGVGGAGLNLYGDIKQRQAAERAANAQSGMATQAYNLSGQNLANKSSAFGDQAFANLGAIMNRRGNIFNPIARAPVQ